MEQHDKHVRLISSRLRQMCEQRCCEERDLIPYLRQCLKKIPLQERPTELACLMETKRLRHKLPLVYS